MPEFGSVSRLVSTFEGVPKPFDQSFHSLDVYEGLGQSSLSAPTSHSAPDKQSIDLSPSAVTKTTSEAGTPSADSIVERESEASAFFSTPETTPDKMLSETQLELPRIRHEKGKVPGVKPGSRRSTKQAAQHTAHKAQARRIKGTCIGRVERC